MGNAGKEVFIDCTPRVTGYIPLGIPPFPFPLRLRLALLGRLSCTGDCSPPIAEGDLETETARLAAEGELFADEFVDDEEGCRGIEGYPSASTLIFRCESGGEGRYKYPSAC